MTGQLRQPTHPASWPSQLTKDCQPSECTEEQYVSLPGMEHMSVELRKYMVKGLSPVTRNLCCQSARGNRSGAVRYFPEAVRPRGNTAAPDRFPRADWQHKFLVTGLNPDYNMVTVRVKHRKVPNRGFQHHGRHFVLRRFWRFPLWFTPPPTLKI